ncbi:hypothetical protein EDC04DRAFT_2611133 [Pisolithus marmoratus]|nr:hypothetical protein EDC04DRAFT_2611133 [Pisolithus marmoratus]
MARTVQNAKKSASGHAKCICKAKDARTHQPKAPSHITRQVPQSMYEPLVMPSNLQSHWPSNKGFMQVAGSASDPMFPEGIYVKGICKRASNSQLLEVALEEYHTNGTLQCEQIIFDFGMQRKFVCDVECGDLFAGQGDDGTDMVTEVTMFITHLFTGGLKDIVFNLTLFLLTCGPVVWITKLFMVMKDAVKFLKPEFAVAFDATNFISTMLKMPKLPNHPSVPAGLFT